LKYQTQCGKVEFKALTSYNNFGPYYLLIKNM